MQFHAPSGGHKLVDTLKIVARMKDESVRLARMKRASPLLLLYARQVGAALDGVLTALEVDELRANIKDALAIADGQAADFVYQNEILFSISPQPTGHTPTDLALTRGFLLTALDSCAIGIHRQAYGQFKRVIVDAAAVHGADPIAEEPTA